MSNDGFIVLDNFQDYIHKTELFQKFHWDGYGSKQGKDVLYNGRIYHINAFSGSDISVSATDILTSIAYSTSFHKQGLTPIITDQDRIIFDECTRLANNIRERIIKQASQVKINEFKIVDLSDTEK